MRLRNKHTGEVKEFNEIYLAKTIKETKTSKNERVERSYCKINELNADWEDYEEPKTFWAISWAGEPEEYDAKKTPQELKDMAQQIGNYFETKEEAEKAVNRLKALAKAVVRELKEEE